MMIASAQPPATVVGELEEMAAKPRTLWRDAITHIRRQKSAVASLLVLLLYVFVGLVGFFPDWKAQPVLERERPAWLGRLSDERIAGPNLPPALRRIDASGNSGIDVAMWFGTDFLGRSVLWRFLFGVRIALTVAILAALVENVIGVVLGATAGFFGGWIDAVIVWLFTTISSVPWILLMVALAYALQGREFHVPFTNKTFPMAGIPTIVLALGLTSWVGLCRLIRAEVLKHRDRDFVIAARAVGLSNHRIIFRHILPNVFHLVIINFSLALAAYVQSEVVLSFLGLGVTDKPSWGRMIDDAKLELLKGVWWQMAAATVAIFIFSLAVNIFGDALRDALDPRLRGTD
jgi:peptide/nickel transport system permease protein